MQTTVQRPTGHTPSDAYVAMVRQRRLYGGIVTALVLALLATGFRVAENRNAGGFLNGLPHLFDFPAAVVAEAWLRKAELSELLI